MGMMKELLKAVKGSKTPQEALDAAVAARKAVEKAEDLAALENFMAKMEGGPQAQRAAKAEMESQGLTPEGKQGLIAVHQTYPAKLDTALKRTEEQGAMGIDMPSFQVTRAGSEVPLDPQFGPLLMIPKAEVIDPAAGRTLTFDADAWVPRDKGRLTALPPRAMGKGIDRLEKKFDVPHEEAQAVYSGSLWGDDLGKGVNVDELVGSATENTPNALGSLIARIGMKDRSKAPSWAFHDEAYNAANNYDLPRAAKEGSWAFLDWVSRNREKGLAKMMGSRIYEKWSRARVAAKELSDEWETVKKEERKWDRLRGRRNKEHGDMERHVHELWAAQDGAKIDMEIAAKSVEQLEEALPYLRQEVASYEKATKLSPMMKGKLARRKKELAEGEEKYQGWLKEKADKEKLYKARKEEYKEASLKAKKYRDEVYAPAATKQMDLEDKLEDLADKGSKARVEKRALEQQTIREWFSKGTEGPRPLVPTGSGTYELNPEGFLKQYPDLGRGREMEMGHGAVDQGMARGVFSRRFEDLDEMRAAARKGQLEGERWDDTKPYHQAIEQNKEAFRKYMKEATEAYDEIMAEAGRKYDDPSEAPFFWHPEGGKPHVEDTLVNKMIRGLREGTSVAKQFGLPYSSPRLEDAVNKMIAAYQRLGSDYFEAKNMERLPLEDFRAAVIPDSASGYEGLIEKLQDAGVEILQPRTLEGNEEMIKSFLRKFMFSVPPAAVLGGAATGE